MCGRFTHLYSWRELHRLMSLSHAAEAVNILPSYNVAPTQMAPEAR